MDLIGRFTPKTLAAAVALAVTAIASNAHAAGLGRLTVQSALGQPLRAEVEITSLSKEEAASLTAKLAPPDAFKQAGLEYNPALTGLSFSIGQRSDGRPVVKVTSNRPVNEPFVDLLVELNWATGKFVREYTFLLDPPELRIAKPGGESTAGAPVVAPSVQTPSAQVSQTPPQAAAPVQAPAPVRAEPRTTTAEPKAAPEPKVAAAKPPRTPRAAPAPRAEAPKAEPVGKAESSAGGSSVTTQRGDTLAGIASRNRGSGVSLDQAIVAIYRANPSAFFGSVNRMRADATLIIPDASQMAAVDPADATKTVRDSSEFRKYRSRLASSSRKLTTAKAGQSASGAVAAADDGKAPGAATRDELKLSKGAPGSKSGTGGAGSKVASAEGAIARDNALKESASRVEQLQKNVKDLEKLLELKNQRIAEIEKQVAEAKAAGKSATGAVTPPPVSSVTPKVDASKPAATAKVEVPKIEAPKVEAPKVEVPKLDTPKVEAPKADAAKTAKIEPPVVPKVDAPVVPPVAAVSPPVTPSPAVTPSPTGNPPPSSVTPPDLKSVTPPAVVPPVAEAPKPAPAPITPAPNSPVVTPSQQSAPEPGILDMLTDNPLIPGGAIALLGLGGAYAWWRRRKKAAPADKYEDSLAAGEEFSANSLFGTTGGQQVDTNSIGGANANTAMNTSMQASQTSMSGPASTEVDPIAEAEVYIAYGREAQAEEILKEALKRQPDRQAIRGKLLEIYAGRKEVNAFSALAKEMHEMTGGQNEEWPKVLTQGLAIDPSNPLFSGDGSKSLGGGIAKTVAAVGAAGAAAIGLGHAAAQPAHNPMPVTNKQAPSFDSPSLEANTDVPAMDFDLRIDSGMGAGSMSLHKDTTVGLAGSRLSQATDAGKQQSASDLARALDGRIDLPSLDLDHRTKAPAKAEPEALSDLEDFKLDLPALETLKGPPAAMGRDPHQDLSPIGLDLTPSTLMGNVGGDSARWQEMATKLDLASAYQDIGDKDGARELLDEVIRGGDTAQQQKAKAMLSKIN